jgi:hypothetical protein
LLTHAHNSLWVSLSSGWNSTKLAMMLLNTSE